jgi:hypothetical protein
LAAFGVPPQSAARAQENHSMQLNVKNLFILLAIASLPAACQSGSSDATEVKASPATGAKPATGVALHAPADVKPGSHEDWCAEHEVPESLCTRCNPALVAAFKATGDWCAEHGLPESQCKLCNPGLKIERPPKEVTP